MAGSGGNIPVRSSGGIWKRIKPNDVLTTATAVVDEIGLSTFISIKYIITIWNTANSKTKVVEMLIMKESASSISDIIFGKISSPSFNIDIDTNINGTNFELEITNNEAYDVSVELAKVKIGKP